VSDNLPRGFLARSPCEDENNFIGADFHVVSPCEVENNFIGADFHVIHSITVNTADIMTL
jgi:hypothetical protein